MVPESNTSAIPQPDNVDSDIDPGRKITVAENAQVCF